ncbi:hypothetical protein P171DRAFT_86673 [Karstenula rhodostoma CBS 690.94]|uniref:Uncharacterized protein n=1 Tax=Karstenula rhodostoma CBS 690.94 TaxID=1392251 RepID=A0A9P4PDJ7_9PLEO|nr:hypothetical protein P171DRAFT_86673 [Karstenula rhodostoma CBS 690.94]
MRACYGQNEWQCMRSVAGADLCSSDGLHRDVDTRAPRIPLSVVVWERTPAMAPGESSPLGAATGEPTGPHRWALVLPPVLPWISSRRRFTSAVPRCLAHAYPPSSPTTSDPRLSLESDVLSGVAPGRRPLPSSRARSCAG